MKNILYGFLTSFIVALIFLVFVRNESDLQFTLRFLFGYTLILGLPFSLVILGIRTAGVALFKDFLEGSVSDKILIILIIIVLAFRIFM